MPAMRVVSNSQYARLLPSRECARALRRDRPLLTWQRMGKLHMLRRPRFRRRLAPTLVALITALYTGPFASALGDVEQRTLRVSVASSVVSVTALCVEPANAAAASSTPLLMLHGASFSAHTWAELNTLQTLSGTGPHSTVPAVPRSVCAVDTPRTRGHQGDVLVGVLDALGWKRAFVVAPSASGRLLWPLLLSESAFRRVAGVVPVAAVGFDAYSERLATSSAASSTPMLVVIGSRCASVWAWFTSQQHCLTRLLSVLQRHGPQRVRQGAEGDLCAQSHGLPA